MITAVRGLGQEETEHVGFDVQVTSLEELAAIDAEIKELRAGIDTERGDIDGVRTELAGLDERLATDGAAVVEMERTRNDLIQELRQIDKQIERSRERMGRARNEREVNAAEREQDELRKLKRDREDEVKKLAELLDQARTTIAKNDDRKAELTGRLEGSLEGATRSIHDLESKLATLEEQRRGALVKVTGLTRRRYEAMHGRGKVPLAKAHGDGTCLGCFVQLPPMLFHRMLQRTAFEECPNCHRIIYYEPPRAEEPEEADASGGAAVETLAGGTGEAASEA